MKNYFLLVLAFGLFLIVPSSAMAESPPFEDGPLLCEEFGEHITAVSPKVEMAFSIERAALDCKAINSESVAHSKVYSHYYGPTLLTKHHKPKAYRWARLYFY